MNFFENQDKARQSTQQLLGLFAIAISIMIVAIYIVLVLLLYVLTFSVETINIIWWQPSLFFWVSAVTISLISLASFYKILCLRQGGCAIAEELGGRLLLTETASEQEQQLLNIVEEMAIASGIPIPKVYLLDREPSINAFAAGFSLNDAVIGVTRGSVEQFNRDELQGVIAHEFSHILNGDMALNLRLVGLLHGILFIYLIGKQMLRIRDNDNDGFRLWILALALMAIGGIGLLCGRLIKAAVSRQREFLADASAVQFTRNSDGISGALQKLEQMDSRLLTPKAEAASHMFFGNAVKIHFWEDKFATHPPLAVRIRRVGGVRVKNISNSSRNIVNSSSNNSSAMGFADSNSQTTTPEKVVAQVGTVTPKQFDLTQELLAELPESLRLGIRETQTSQAILFALFLEQNSPLQEKQLSWLNQVQPEELVNSTVKFNQEIANLNTDIYLPLVDLTIPALRQLPPKECQRVCKCTQGLIAAKKQASVRDFVLRLILWHRLQPLLQPDCNITVKFNSIEEIWSDCLIVLSALAQIGENSAESAAYAFSSGIYQLPGATQQEKPKAPLKCNFSQLKKSIENLRQATPKLKQSVVQACAHIVLVDNKITAQEKDLLRAIAMTLDCPIPPFLKSKRKML
ncbi:MAG: M48 family metallopeptidase [Cyanobacteria bacterium P01_C01_bin.38]